MTEFRKYKKITQTKREEIIEYAKANGIASVKEKYGIWPETVRYWMKEGVREKVKQNQKERHDKKKQDKEYVDRRNEYRKARQESGIARKKWLEWRSTLSEEELKERIQRIKQHRLDNIESYKEKARERYQRDKEQGIHRQRYNNDPIYKMKCNIREHVRQALKYSNVSKKHPSIKYLGCSIEEFKVYIESKFTDGMTWENHSRGEECWHLDHIRPLAQLKDIADEQTLKAICHYTNYQPLWEKDNLSKQDKYEE